MGESRKITPGEYGVTVADSLVIGSAGSTPDKAEYVVVLMEFVQDDSENPVGRLVYRAPPALARQLAVSLNKYADDVERDQT